MRHLLTRVVTIFLFLLTINSYASTPHYAIIIDAGSSGSRIHLFQYDDAMPLPRINELFSESASPGLSSFANQPELAGPALKKLFDDAAEQLHIQHIEQQAVSVDVLATAGIRLLAPEAQQAIYQSIQTFLQKNYHFNIQHIETISGKMEGVYGWLDVNYLADRFTSSNSTYGIIDMGGASSEVAYATTDDSKSEDEISLSIAGKSYIVYSKSILGAGQDKAREAMNLYADANACYPTNYVNGVTTGLFNYQTCHFIYTSVINKLMQHSDMPTIGQQQFIAYSGIFYAFHFFEADQQPTKENINQKILGVCTQHWEQLRQDPKYASVADKYLSTYCANGIYQMNLLFNTYQLQDHQLHVQDKVNQKNIDWTLGALLFELL